MLNSPAQRPVSAYPASTTIFTTEMQTGIIIKILALAEMGNVSAGPKVNDAVKARKKESG